MSSKLVLVLNCGSSSLKFAIIDAVNGDEFLSGLAECFHLPEARIKWKMDGAKHEAALGAGAAHSEALNFIVNTILAQKPELSAQLTAIGHRIVHGGEKFTASAVINDEVLQGIKDSVPFAPLHNPAHLIGIAEALKSFPNLADKNVAVFDTAFHQTMPEESYLYALPYSLYRDHGVRRYGAHGTSHFYVTQEAAKMLNKPVEEVNVITCHLGNGGSVTAVRNGQCVDTSVVPVLLRKFGERVAALDTGVVDQDVYRADVRFDTVDGGMHRLGVGDVERRRIGAQPLFTQAIGGVPGMFFGGGVDQNMRALLCQAARQQKTNAARGTSD